MGIIFVVEDDPRIRRFLVTLFAEQHEVLQAGSFPEALEKMREAKERNCRVAVLDGSLGHHAGDGKEVAERLRAEMPGIRVISHSAENQDWGDLNLLKPAPLEELLEAVRC